MSVLPCTRMPPHEEAAATYRRTPALGPDPATEAEAITELIHRTTAFRRVLLKMTLAASIGGGFAGIALYVGVATQVYGRVGGACFATGSILTFAVLHRVSGWIAARRESRWIAELAGKYRLEAEALTEAMEMFRG